MELFFLLLAVQTDEDRDFMEQLFVDFQRLMYAQALMITHSRAVAEDVVSDSLVALIKKINIIRPMQRNILRAYVVITVRNTALNVIRRQKTSDGVERIVPIEDMQVSTPQDGEYWLMRKERMEFVKNAIRSLPEKEKQVMMMKYFQDWSDDEIAASMGIKEGSVRSLTNRSRKHLRIMMESEVARNVR